MNVTAASTTFSWPLASVIRVRLACADRTAMNRQFWTLYELGASVAYATSSRIVPSSSTCAGSNRLIETRCRMASSADRAILRERLRLEATRQHACENRILPDEMVEQRRADMHADERPRNPLAKESVHCLHRPFHVVPCQCERRRQPCKQRRVLESGNHEQAEISGIVCVHVSRERHQDEERI